MKPSLCAIIGSVKAESEYGGSAFDWTVGIRINSTEIDCYEGKSHVTSDDVGQEVDLVLLAQQADGHIAPEKSERGISQPGAINSGTSKWHTKLVGEIHTPTYGSKEFGSNDNIYLLDVGVGVVLVSPSAEFEEHICSEDIQIGSTVHIEAGRIDIIDRNY